jgi:hypothetical protein
VNIFEKSVSLIHCNLSIELVDEVGIQSFQ